MRIVLQFLAGAFGLATLVFAGLCIWFGYQAALTPGPSPEAFDATFVSLLSAFVTAVLGGAAFGLSEEIL